MRREPWVQREDLTHNDRVKLFDRKALKDCLEEHGLEGPYRRRKDVKRFTTAYPMFGFGLWEAKSSSGGTHRQTLVQTARKLKALLRWQRKIFDKADCKDFCPLAWFFSSVGSSWEIAACYENKHPGQEECCYVSIGYPLLSVFLRMR